MEIQSSTTVTAMRPGNSGQAVGQLAKAAIAEAKAAGVELPKNAQGVAASAIAKGADPASVFAATVTPDPAVDPVPGDPDPAPVTGGEDDTVSAAQSGYTAFADAVGTQTDAETALALLEPST